MIFENAVEQRARNDEPERDAPVRSKHVLVVGGYGAVGREISRLLSSGDEFSVIVAGRRIDEANSHARQIGGTGRRLDLGDASTWTPACEGVDCVVMCMDQHDVPFVEFLFRRGIHYADITASDAFFREVEWLAPTVSSAMLSVGLAPGLTNILAAHCASRLDRTREINIGLLAGLGDEHGQAGLEWIADRMFDPGRERSSTAFEFGFGAGRRNTHRLDFSDQHALRRTLKIGSASTSICFDSRLATAAMFKLAGRYAGGRRVRAAMLAAARRVRIGGRMCNISVHAHGFLKGRRAVASAHFAGEGESQTTARLAALQIAAFLRRTPVAGVRHSHEILDLDEMLRTVAEKSIGKIMITPVRLVG